MKKILSNTKVLAIISIVSISISIFALIPNTVAYFTKSISSKGNTITSASLNFNAKYQNENNNYIEITNTPTITNNHFNIQAQNTGTAKVELRLSVVQNGKQVAIKNDDTFIYNKLNVLEVGTFEKIDLSKLENGEFIVKIEYKYLQNTNYGSNICEYLFNYIKPNDILTDAQDDNNINNELEADGLLENEDVITKPTSSQEVSSQEVSSEEVSSEEVSSEKVSSQEVSSQFESSQAESNQTINN